MDKSTRRSMLWGFLGGGIASVALRAVGVPSIFGVDTPAKKCIETMPVKVDLTDPALWRPFVIKYGKAAVGTDEKGDAFQSFIALLDWVKTKQGCRVSRSYGRVFGGVHGNRDIVDTIWVRLGNEKMMVFFSEHSCPLSRWTHNPDVEEIVT